MVDFQLNGRTALVTGSTRGIGLAVADTLEQYGARVIRHNSRIADLASVEDTARLLAEAGAVDILVLNASCQHYRTMEEVFDEKEFADVVGLVVRQWRVPVQFTESFEDVISPGTVFVGGECGMLTMQKNRILNKFFNQGQKAFGVRMFLEVAFEKLFELMIGEIHGEFKRIDPVTQILTLRQNALRFLAMKKNTEFLKRAIRTFALASVQILCLLPTHAAFPHVKISKIKRQGNALGLKRHRMQWVVLYSITSSIFCQ